MTSYRGVEAADWFGYSLLQSQIVGYAITTSRIDSMNRKKTLNEGSASGRALIFIWTPKDEDVIAWMLRQIFLFLQLLHGQN